MLRKIVNIFAVIVLLPVFVSAQEHTILKPDGTTYTKYGDLKKVEALRVLPGRTRNQINQNTNTSFSQTPLSPDATVDTLRYDPPWDTNFGYFGQDWMLQWFVAPAEIVLLFAGFATNENDDAMPVELKIVRVNWTAEDLATAGTAQHGWYEALGNGYNDITAFLDNPDITDTNWISVDGGLPEPFGNDIWSDGGVGFTIVPVGGAETDYQWVDMSYLAEPVFSEGEIFGIAIKHNGSVMDTNRIGYWASGVNPQWAWKFYANGRTSGDLSTAGWWSRKFHWNFRAVVDITTGNGRPRFNSFTVIPSGLDTGPFTIDAEIIFPTGFASANINWTNDGGNNWNTVPMTNTSGNNYTGQIPAQSPNTTVEYFLDATDINGIVAETSHIEFFIFSPSGATTLVIYNGLRSIHGYPQDYYWGLDIQSGNEVFVHDRWAYGELPMELINNYTNIIEICNSGPFNYNESIIRPWLEADGTHNYYLTGQEWLGSRHSFVDQDFAAGSFEFDILGINHSYNDVSYDGSSGQGIPSLVMPAAGTLFGNKLLNLFNSLDPPADSMMYNPVYEVGMDNWIDAFAVEADVTVDMNVEIRGIEGLPNVQILPTMIHRTLAAGNKIVFVAYDPLSLNTANDGSFPYYFWIGIDEANSPYQALNWFGIDIISDVEESNGEIPTEFSLSQNYPNPFNPSTIISWQSPVGSWQTLKVYDVLGNEVASLVDEYKPAGNYEVEFNLGSGIRNLASGIYFYQLRVVDPSTGSGQGFIQTKKMVFLK